MNNLNIDSLVSQHLDRPIYYVTPNLNYALGLAQFLPQLHIITNDSDLFLTEYFTDQSIAVHQIQDSQIPSNAGSLLAHHSSQAYITQTSVTGLQPMITAFKSSPQLLKQCQLHNYLPAFANPQTNRILEDKIEFSNLVKDFNLPLVPFQISTLNQIQINNLPYPVIVQTNRGWAGKGSYLINTPQELDQLRTKLSSTTVKISSYTQGHVLTVNGCVFQKHVFISPVAYQLNQDAQNPLATTGRSWPGPFLNPQQEQQLEQIRNSVQQLLNHYQFHGFFGLDLLITPQQIFLLEINPRFTASESFFTQAQLKQNQLPLSLLHLLSFIRNQPQIGDHALNYEQVSGTQIVLRNQTQSYLSVSSQIRSGLYQVNNHQLEFINPSHIIPTIPDQFLIKISHNNVSSGSELAILETFSPVLNQGQFPPYLAVAIDNFQKILHSHVQ